MGRSSGGRGRLSTDKDLLAEINRSPFPMSLANRREAFHLSPEQAQNVPPTLLPEDMPE